MDFFTICDFIATIVLTEQQLTRPGNALNAPEAEPKKTKVYSSGKEIDLKVGSSGLCKQMSRATSVRKLVLAGAGRLPLEPTVQHVRIHFNSGHNEMFSQGVFNQSAVKRQ